MAFKRAARVKETSTTTGTGTYDLVGAVAGFQGFVAGIGTANTCEYTATDGTNWEEGIGTVTDAAPDTLARTRILASSNAGAAVSWAAGTRTIMNSLSHLGMLPPGHIFGCIMSNAADAANDITVTAGSVRDESDQVDMRLTSAITKQLDAAWAVGTAAGGLNTGGEAADTWYEVHVIMRIDTGVVDVMFTTTANRATLPTNYTHSRRIGWIRNDAASAILAFTQIDDYFTLTTQINDIAVALTTTATAAALTAPPNSIARFRATMAGDGATVQGQRQVVVFSEIVEGNVTPAVTTGIGSLSWTGGDATVGNNDGSAAGHFELRLDSSSQIEYDCVGDTSGTLDVSTFGWIDHRGRLS